MNDIFNEQIVKKQMTSQDNYKKIGLGAISFIGCVIATLFVPYIGLFLGVGILFGGVFLISMLDVEYEYALTNNIFEVDCIYNKRRRKKKIEFDLNDIVVIAKLNENKEQHTFNTAKKTFQFVSGTNDEECYKAIVKQNGENILVTFEPNEKILEGFKRYCKVLR